MGFVIGIQPGKLVFGFCTKLIDPGVFLTGQIFTDLLDLGAGFFFKCGIEFLVCFSASSERAFFCRAASCMMALAVASISKACLGFVP